MNLHYIYRNFEICHKKLFTKTDKCLDLNLGKDHLLFDSFNQPLIHRVVVY